MNWYADNEVRAYPLRGDDDGAIPQDILVDAFLQAPTTLGTALEIYSISVTPLVASVVFAINGEPVAYSTSSNTPDIVHRSLELSPIVAGVRGYFAWGSGVSRSALRVDGAYPLVDTALVGVPLSDDATLSLRGHPLTGRVRLIPGPGMRIESGVMDVRLEDTTVITTPVAIVRLAGDIRLLPLSPCEISAEASASPQPIRGINGVVPHPDTGDIDLVPLVVKRLESEPDITLESSPGGLIIRDYGEPCA